MEPRVIRPEDCGYEIRGGGNATSVFIVGWATGGLIFGMLGDRMVGDPVLVVDEAHLLDHLQLEGIRMLTLCRAPDYAERDRVCAQRRVLRRRQVELGRAVRPPGSGAAVAADDLRSGRARARPQDATLIGPPCPR